MGGDGDEAGMSIGDRLTEEELAEIRRRVLGQEVDE